MLSFDNTEVAFSGKSNAELNRAYWLFKLIGNPSLVKVGKQLTNVALSLHLPIGWVIKPTIFKQFCGGETIEECKGTIVRLGQFNIGTILDYSIEGKEDEATFDATCQEIIRTIEAAAKDPKNIPFSVFKLSGLATVSLLEAINTDLQNLGASEQKSYLDFHRRVEAICKKAFERGVRIFIDAEESWLQDGIDRIATEMMVKYNRTQPIVYNTVQMYRHDRLEFLKKAVAEAKHEGYFYGVKLVRGAYMEKERARAAKQNYPSPIQPNKAASDRDFNAALEFCVENHEHVALCAGTHNEDSSKLLAALIEKKGISHNDPHFFFAQLLGMSDHISYNLAHEGYNVAKYVPYGPVREVVPYLIRRAEENTSVKGQTGRELGLIIKEKQRRKG
ncbi:MAG: proline dehydrogenase family protein [Bacteroidota bacterium]